MALTGLRCGPARRPSVFICQCASFSPPRPRTPPPHLRRSSSSASSLVLATCCMSAPSGASAASSGRFSMPSLATLHGHGVVMAAVVSHGKAVVVKGAPTLRSWL